MKTDCKAADLKPKVPEGLPPDYYFDVQFYTCTAMYRHITVSAYQEKPYFFGLRKKAVLIGQEHVVVEIDADYKIYKEKVEAKMRTLYERFIEERSLRLKYLYGRHP